MAFLEIDGLKKRFGNVEILKGIDVELEKGGFLVLVGPSGCGKSTLLNTIAGLEQITEGEIRVDGRAINDLHPSKRDIAMVFQSYALYPNMTVAGNISFGMEMRGVPADERQKAIDKVAKVLQIGHLLNRKPSQLSGGQRQRVAMGRALVRGPAAFLLDEPLSNLDAKLRVQMRLQIRDLQRSVGTTALYVTHDQVEAMTLADRLIVMNAGVAEQIGTPMDVYDKPASVFVAGFIGSPAMNFLAAKVGSDGKSVDLAAAGARPVSLPLAVTSSAAPGTPVAVGLRPEHLLPSSDGPLEFSIELAEPLGADTLLHGRFGDARELVTVRQGGHVTAQPGELRRFSIGATRLHLFDSRSGRRIADA